MTPTAKASVPGGQVLLIPAVYNYVRISGNSSSGPPVIQGDPYNGRKRSTELRHAIRSRPGLQPRPSQAIGEHFRDARGPTFKSTARDRVALPREADLADQSWRTSCGYVPIPDRLDRVTRRSGLPVDANDQIDRSVWDMHQLHGQPSVADAGDGCPVHARCRLAPDALQRVVDGRWGVSTRCGLSSRQGAGTADLAWGTRCRLDGIGPCALERACSSGPRHRRPEGARRTDSSGRGPGLGAFHLGGKMKTAVLPTPCRTPVQVPRTLSVPGIPSRTLRRRRPLAACRERVRGRGAGCLPPS